MVNHCLLRYAQARFETGALVGIVRQVGVRASLIVKDNKRRWVRRGYFPRVRVGKRYLIPAKFIDGFLKSRLEIGPRPCEAAQSAAKTLG